MAVKLSEADHKLMDKLIDQLLEWHKAGEVSLGSARGAFAHVITAAAIGNEGELRAWLKPETLAEWKKMVDQHPG